MKMFVKEMNRQYANQILNWTYSKPYDLYNNEPTERAFAELLNNSYSVIVDEHDEIVGFFCIGESAQVPVGTLFDCYNKVLLDIGLGMKPELTGKGLGFEFFSFIIEFLYQTYGKEPLRLTVAEFNERAIRLYEKLGFVKKDEFYAVESKFITMVKE